MRPLTPLVSLLLAALASAQTPRTTTRLEGVVIDPQHRPVGNAEVILEDDGVVVQRTRTDGNGVFVVPRAPSRYVLVRTTADGLLGGALVGGELVDLWGGGRAFVRVRTMPARKVHGVVRDDIGQPIADAWVGARPNYGMPAGLAHCSTRSDSKGRYVLEHVATGSVIVRAWSDKNDSGAFATHFAGTSDHELDCTLVRDDAIWWDIRLENATPEQLEKATVKFMAFQRRAQMPIPRELAQPKPVAPGHWRIAGWSKLDRVHVWAEIPGISMWPGEHVIKSGVGRTKRRFSVGDSDGEIRGQLRDDAGKPAAGVELMLQPTQGGGVNSHRRIVTTDDEGRFAVQAPVQPGVAFAVRSTSPGTTLVGNAPNPVWYQAEHESGRSHELQARPSRAVRLQLVTSEGQPVAGATVSLALGENEQPRTIAGGVSALDGSVTMSCLNFDVPARLTINACGPEGVGEFEVVAKGDQEIALGRLTLGPAAEIRGQVVDADGNPEPAARVTLSRNDRFGWSQQITTDREGRFVFRGLLPGNYMIHGRGPNHWQRQPVQLDDAEQLDVVLTVND
ncbi:MAG: carboxypeptidase-like regulatory domain-containing protein [bacterium]|nr:carboxypeptidase-like regulatory domain-containing protein [bacterium]